MNSIEQLKYLIEHYSKGEYTPWDFASQFAGIYYIHHDSSLTEEHKKYYERMAECCEFFSPEENDLELLNSPFKSEKELNMIVAEYQNKE